MISSPEQNLAPGLSPDEKTPRDRALEFGRTVPELSAVLASDLQKISEEHRYSAEAVTAIRAIEDEKVDALQKLEKQLGVPVLDGVICALIIATGLVKYGVSTSKIRRYNPNY